MICYLCTSRLTLFIVKNGYRIYRCPRCGLLQTELGKPYWQFLKEFYTSGYFQGDIAKGAYKDYQEDKPFIARNMHTFFSRLLRVKQKGKLLDVGCAYGYGVELALKRGFDAYGFDPSPDAIAKSTPEVKHRIREGSITDVTYPEKTFDAITLFDVFEHLSDPIADLKKLATFLKDDGVVMIATGDTGSLAAKILKRRWTFYIPPQHLFFFNRETITETLKRAGLVPVTFFRIGKWLSLSYVLHLAQTTGESRVAALLTRLTHIFHLGPLPLYLPMGDNMVVIARKKRA